MTSYPAVRKTAHHAPVLAELEFAMHRTENCNAKRTHSGKYCYGKAPLQTFIESVQLAHNRQLDRIAATVPVK
jgi:hypothetical protein